MTSTLKSRSDAITVFTIPVRVYYEDTDSAGVVYYANYLKFMERARTEFLRGRGLEQDQMRDEEGVIFAVRTATVEYLRPARFNYALDVTAKVEEVSGATVTFAQEVYWLPNRSSGEVAAPSQLLCTGEFKIACLDANTLRPRRMPDSILKEFVR